LEDLAIQMAQSREKVLALDIRHESEKANLPRTTNYFELPENEPEHRRLELEKLNRLRGLFLFDDGPKIKPPRKTKEEIQSLLQKLREQAIVTTQSLSLLQPNLVPTAELLPKLTPDDTTHLQLRPRL
jgi:hypothetical protein